MNLLTVIGNAVVDYKFRTLLLRDPIKTVEKYGFRLSKFEKAMLTTALQDSTELRKRFKDLDLLLYKNIGVLAPEPGKTRAAFVPVGCHQRPCTWSLMVPTDLQDEYDAVNEEKETAQEVKIQEAEKVA